MLQAISRRAAVLLENIENASVRGCRFESVGGTAVVVSRHARDVSITGNVVLAPGDTGVSLAGSFANGTSKGVAHPAAINVTGNLVSEVGTYSRQGSCFPAYAAVWRPSSSAVTSAGARSRPVASTRCS